MAAMPPIRVMTKLEVRRGLLVAGSSDFLLVHGNKCSFKKGHACSLTNHVQNLCHSSAEVAIPVLQSKSFVLVFLKHAQKIVQDLDFVDIIQNYAFLILRLAEDEVSSDEIEFVCEITPRPQTRQNQQGTRQPKRKWSKNPKENSQDSKNNRRSGKRQNGGRGDRGVTVDGHLTRSGRVQKRTLQERCCAFSNHPILTHLQVQG